MRLVLALSSQFSLRTRYAAILRQYLFVGKRLFLHRERLAQSHWKLAMRRGGVARLLLRHRRRRSSRERNCRQIQLANVINRAGGFYVVRGGAIVDECSA